MRKLEDNMEFAIAPTLQNTRTKFDISQFKYRPLRRKPRPGQGGQRQRGQNDDMDPEDRKIMRQIHERRKFAIDACIVRLAKVRANPTTIINKTRQSGGRNAHMSVDQMDDKDWPFLTMAQIINLVMESMKEYQGFMAEKRMIKERVANLIERGYIDRKKKEKKHFIYKH